MADPTAVSQGLRQCQDRPKISDEEETTFCPADRAAGASQSVSEVQTPNETPLGSRCAESQDLMAVRGIGSGLAMAKISMGISQKLQERGVSFLPEDKPGASKADIAVPQESLLQKDFPLAKVRVVSWLTRSLRRKRPIPPAPGSRPKQENTHTIVLDQLKEEQETTSGRTSCLSMPDALKEQHMKHRPINDQLKEISDRNEVSTWLHDSSISEGGETMELLRCSMQKASSKVSGFLYFHELVELFPRLDGNTWDAKTTEELLAKSGLEFSKDGKIEVATFLDWLVQTAASERVRPVG
eukprot:CAMPEP_0172890020 /NCGR_PEP_ID=MMETSP1075-20121228/140214_1 /TAXON_ID=2916 /ORGANISM="Ceratium fusus, Strain PA161109" /LENGTH=297 /DNA_ID=CAMNT_0013744201 /DNA_START=1 /DNA_END=894 /DNA_ORIENTATION=-